MNDYFTVFILSLMKLFSTDQQLLDDRGSFIIRYGEGSFIIRYDRDHSLSGTTGIIHYQVHCCFLRDHSFSLLGVVASVRNFKKTVVSAHIGR